MKSVSIVHEKGGKKKRGGRWPDCERYRAFGLTGPAGKGRRGGGKKDKNKKETSGDCGWKPSIQGEGGRGEEPRRPWLQSGRNH